MSRVGPLRALRSTALAAALAATFGLALAPAPGDRLLPGGPLAVRAADPPFSMTTAAIYEVHPDDRNVAVSVAVTFTNTTPDPAGKFSVFDTIDLAIQDGATSVGAHDSRGQLRVSAARNEEGTTVASVSPRGGVRYKQQVTFTLTYLIPDAASSSVRVRPSVVIFPAWSFGTSGTVEVRVPATYEVAVDGDPLDASRQGASWVLHSGAVDDPSRWLSLVVASRGTSYATASRSVALDSGTVDLQVRAWQDDAAWGERVADLLARALPLLEREIGLDYPVVGPLVVVESLPGAAGPLSEPLASGTQIAAGFDEPDFTLVHQLAHVWLGERLVADRWIREGFASRAAAAVAPRLEIQPPFEPGARRDELAADAFPLARWDGESLPPAQEQYAYAASWAVAVQVEQLVGADALRAAWRRVAAGTAPYQPVTDAQAAERGLPVVPADARALLDQLEAVSDADVASLFGAFVLDAEAAAQLEARAAARAELDGLLAAAAGWGAPDPVQLAMSAWRFDDARAAIGEATAWLADRDRLVAEVEATGLKLPQRLRDVYLSAGGGDDARTELDAERAVAEAYAATLARAREEPSILARIGLAGGARPADVLAEAHALFGDGDLRGAADRVAEAQRRLDAAVVDGVVRLAAVVILVGLVLALAVWLARRRRADDASDYTAAP